jgi:hypothetical protein
MRQRSTDAAGLWGADAFAGFLALVAVHLGLSQKALSKEEPEVENGGRLTVGACTLG